MSNSPLVNYTKISPHRDSPRKHKIDTITIHCVVGQIHVEPLGEIFQHKLASSNYGIGKDGRIGMYVEEKDRSYCSSSASNDNRAITIEVASDMTEPYAVNEKAWASLIKLLVDICKRNDIKELKWKADKSLIGQVDKQNMTVHRWFHPGKSCPGTYLYERMGQIAAEVNAKLGVPVVKEEKKKLYRVQIGAFKSKTNAMAHLNNAVKAGFKGFIVSDDNLYRVQIGAFSNKTNAENYLKQAKSKGFEGFIVESDTKAPLKPVSEVAKEVLRGDWGNGTVRKKRLEEAGYNYAEVQAAVSKLL